MRRDDRRGALCRRVGTCRTNGAYAPVPMNEKRQAIRLERLLPAQVLAGLRNAVPCSTPTFVIITNLVSAKVREKAFGITIDVMRR
jgi:hypothetical protein